MSRDASTIAAEDPPADVDTSQARLQRRLRLYESAFVGVIAALVVWSARPLLEEWEYLRQFEQLGLAALKANIAQDPMRPVAQIANYVVWVGWTVHPVGSGVMLAGLMVLGYVAVRWAVSPMVSNSTRIIVSALGMILIPWPAALLLRFMLAHLSALFLFFAFGAGIRFVRSFKARWLVVTAIASLGVLMAYQGLAACLLAIPLVLSIFSVGTSEIGERRLRIVRSGLVLLAVLGGFVVYACFAQLVSLNGSMGYEGNLSAGEIIPSGIADLATRIGRLFGTAYFGNPWVLPMMVLLLAAVTASATGGVTAGSALRRLGLPLLALALLPLAALPYALYPLHLADPDRVLLPVGVAFVLLTCIVGARTAGSTKALSIPSLHVMALCAIVAAALTLSVAGVQRARLQEAVLSQLMPIDASTDAERLLVRDQSGLLGDVYSFYGSYLTTALAAEGSGISADLCTPLGVDRIAPDARRFPIPTTPRCEEMPADTYDLVVDAYPTDAGLTLVVNGPG